MKRFIWVFVLAIIWSVGAVGKPVSRDVALKAARTFLISRGYTDLLPLHVVQQRLLEDGTISMYVINLQPKGWVIVSGDDVVQPVLAYSFESEFDQERGWTEAAKYLVSGYEQQIEQVIKRNLDERHSEWSRLESNFVSKSAEDAIIDPIIKVKWNQSSGWNRFAPEDEDGPGGNAYIGCVAVSMSQAMSVYEYPVKGKGKKSYVHEDYGSLFVNFDAQDAYEWSSMSATSSDDFNAKLLYDCAVSVEMDFGPDGSGAYTRNAAASLVRYFNYSASVDHLDRFDDDDEWTDLLVGELMEGRPIIYEGNPGDGTAGHAWNVDGYGNGYFHMNFGWSGSQNGYYTLDLINPGSNDFNSGQGAIIGIVPPVSGPYDLNLSSYEVDEDLPLGSYVAEVLVADEDSDNTYTYTCYGRWNPILENFGKARFYVENDTLWTDRVFEFDDQDPDANQQFLLIEVEDQYGNTFKKEFFIEVIEGNTGSTAVENHKTRELQFYPNPADRGITLEVPPDPASSLEIYQIATGQLLSKIKVSDGYADLSEIPDGIYLLVHRSEEGIVSQKLVVQH